MEADQNLKGIEPEGLLLMPRWVQRPGGVRLDGGDDSIRGFRPSLNLLILTMLVASSLSLHPETLTLSGLSRKRS